MPRRRTIKSKRRTRKRTKRRTRKRTKRRTRKRTKRRTKRRTRRRTRKRTRRRTRRTKRRTKKRTRKRTRRRKKKGGNPDGFGLVISKQHRDCEDLFSSEGLDKYKDICKKKIRGGQEKQRKVYYCNVRYPKHLRNKDVTEDLNFGFCRKDALSDMSIPKFIKKYNITKERLEDLKEYL